MKRPLLVTVIGVVMVLIGLFQGFIGAVTFSKRNDADFLADVDQPSSKVGTWGVALLAFGVVSLLLGLALLSGSHAARMLVGVFEVAQIAGGVWLLVDGKSSQRGSAIGAIVGALVVLYFLFGTQKAKDYYA